MKIIRNSFVHGANMFKSPILLYVVMAFTILLCFYTIFLLKRSQVPFGFLMVDENKPKIQHAYEGYENDLMLSQKNLNNMDLIRRENSEVLPTTSYFGTNFSDISDICKGSDSANCVRKFRFLGATLKTAKPYNLMVCIIQKNMSTFLMAIMCLLHNKERYMESHRTLATEGHDTRFCAKQNEFFNILRMEKFYHITPEDRKRWKYFAVTREPMERFISGYVDKCIRRPRPPDFCNNCGANITCFVISEYNRMLNQSKSYELERSFEDIHFFPQNWRCNFKDDLSKYEIVKYSNGPSETTFMRDIFQLFSNQGVDGKTLRFIQDQMELGRTVQSTVYTSAREFFENRLRSSPFLIEFVIRMFYYDYELFGYSLPKLI